MSQPGITSIAELYRSKSSRLRKSASKAADALFPADQGYNDTICLVREDITKLEVDAIVNAANKSLKGGGGVDGAIHRAAGPQLLEECKTLKGCEEGSAKMTKAYGKLLCRRVIHAVGPIYGSSTSERRGGHEKMLRDCYQTSLELAEAANLKSIAFSAISTGVYGYPNEEAAEVVLKTVREFLDQRDSTIKRFERIVFCNFSKKDVDAYERYIPKYFPPTKEDLGEFPDEDDESDKGESSQAPSGKRQGDISADKEPAKKRAKVDSSEERDEEVKGDGKKKTANGVSKEKTPAKESDEDKGNGKEEAAGEPSQEKTANKDDKADEKKDKAKKEKKQKAEKKKGDEAEEEEQKANAKPTPKSKAKAKTDKQPTAKEPSPKAPTKATPKAKAKVKAKAKPKAAAAAPPGRRIQPARKAKKQATSEKKK